MREIPMLRKFWCQAGSECGWRDYIPCLELQMETTCPVCGSKAVRKEGENPFLPFSPRFHETGGTLVLTVERQRCPSDDQLLDFVVRKEEILQEEAVEEPETWDPFLRHIFDCRACQQRIAELQS